MHWGPWMERVKRQELFLFRKMTTVEGTEAFQIKHGVKNTNRELFSCNTEGLRMYWKLLGKRMYTQ